jgi:hypothetical protein
MNDERNGLKNRIQTTEILDKSRRREYTLFRYIISLNKNLAKLRGGHLEHFCADQL